MSSIPSLLINSSNAFFVLTNCVLISFAISIVFEKEGGGTPIITDDKFTSGNNGFGGQTTPENPIDVNGVIRKRGLGQTNGVEFDDQVIFALSSASGGGHTTVQEKVDGQGTRFYLMPKGSMASQTALASGVKFFSTDYEADDVNYHDFGIWVTQEELIFNSKQAGTFPENLPFVWKYQDTNDVLRLNAKDRGGMFLNVPPANQKEWNPLFVPFQIHNTTVLASRSQGAASSEFMDNAYYDGSWKRLASGFCQRMSFDTVGTIAFFNAVNGAANSAISWKKVFTIKNETLNAVLPTYADEAAAVVGGLSTNDFYKTATGELRIKL